MEVYFLDVGLGTCQILLLGKQRAIVIDSGVKTDYLALQLLQRANVTNIVRLITSHSDNDHTGGALSILGHYQDAVEEIHAVQDHKWLSTSYWKRIDSLCSQGRLTDQQVVRLELNPANTAKLIWSEGNSSLKLYSPTFVQNQRAQQASNSNTTSAVLVLEHLGRRFIFAADSEIPQWRTIHATFGTMNCDILAVPHHGGHIGDSPGDLQWLYDHAIKADFAVISVGTKKNPKHPRAEVVQALVANGTKVMCTEITKLCHPSPGQLSPGVLQPTTQLGRSADAHRRGKTHCVGCAGTVMALVTPSALTIERIAEHQSAIDRLIVNQGTPLCRPQSNTTV